MRHHFWNALKRLARRAKAKNHSPRKFAHRRFHCEMLEPRQMLAATLNLVGNTLTFTLDSGVQDAKVSGSSNQLTFDAGVGFSITSNAAAQTLGYNSLSQTSGPGALTGVTSVVITGAAGNEKFTIGVFDTTTIPGLSIDLGAGTGDVLAKTDGTNTWNVTAANSGTVAGSGISGSGIFANVEGITGGSGADTFTFSNAATLSGTIDGGAGTDSASYAAYTTSLPISMAKHLNLESLTGGTASDTLTGADVTNTWNVTGTNSGTLNGMTFGSFENLTGGTGADTFTFSNAAAVSGTIDGGAGTDSASYAAYTTSLSIGMAKHLNLESLTGGTASDTLTGADVTNTWNVTGANSGTLNGMTFSSFENLTGGTGADTFTIGTTGSITGAVNGGAGTDTLVQSDGSNAWGITGANSGTVPDVTGGFSNVENLTGGTGADTFTFSNAATLAGTIDGGAGTDSVSYSAYTTSLSISMAKHLNLESITGGSASDTLTGPDATNTWNVTGANSGTLNGMTFSSFENLTGGTGADTFTFSNAATLAGTIDGGAGTDSVSYSAYTTSLSISMAKHLNLESITGGSASDTLTGPDATNTWNVTGTNSGTLNGMTFSSFENLTGGTGADTFTFSNAATLAGTIDGGAGTDSVSYSAYTTSLSISMAKHLNLESITGGSASDTLTGPDATNTWNVTGANSGTLNGMTFSSFENLTGGTGADTFTFSNAATLSGTIDGGAGTDSVSYSAYTTSLSISMAKHLNLESITGGSASDTLTGPDATNTWNVTGTNSGTLNGMTFSSFENLTGGTGADTFNVTAAASVTLKGGAGSDLFNVGATLTGSIDGEGGSDELKGSQINSVALSSSGANGLAGTEADVTGGFAGIDTLTGTGAVGSILTGRDTTSTWGLDGTPTYSDGTATLNFSGFATLQGGTAADTFNVTAATVAVLKGGAGNDLFDLDAALTGSVDGEGGSDTLQGDVISPVKVTHKDANGKDGTANGAAFKDIETINSTTMTFYGDDAPGTWDLDGTPTYTTGGTTVDISEFAVLQGGSDVDTFNVTAATTMTLNGGAGGDVFNIGAKLTGAIAGEAGSDTLQGTAIGGVVLNGSTADGFAGTEADVTGGFAGIDTLAGSGAAGSSLTGENAIGTWNLSATPTYSDGVYTLSFSTFETLQGGSLVDTFKVSAAIAGNISAGAGVDLIQMLAGGSVTGKIDGGSSATLDFSAQPGPIAIVLTGVGTIDGFQGTATGVGSFDNITEIKGSAGADTLTGVNGLSTWNLGATQTYVNSAQTLTFSGIEILQGGTAADTFNVTAPTTEILKGGAGADLFDVDARLTGSIDGEAGADTLQGDVINVVVLTGSTANGLAGNEADVTAGFAGIDTLTGTGAVGSSLTGENAVSTWGLDGTPTYFDAAQTLAFSGFATLQGGSAADTFNVTAPTTEILKGGNGNDLFDIDAKLTGSIDGEAGADTLQGDVIDVVVLTASTANGFTGTEADVTAGFAGIDTLTGTGAVGSSLTGENVLSTWGLDGTPTYSDGPHTLNFSGFATLQGGAAADTFNVTAATVANLKGGAGNDEFLVIAPVIGSLDGQSDNDLLAGPAIDAVTLTGSNLAGFAGVEADVTGGFAGIDMLAGTSGGGSVLTGEGTASDWDLDATPTYSDGAQTLAFSGFDTLQGGAAADAFNLQAAMARNLKGGPGNDVYDIDAKITGSIDGQGGSDTLEGGAINDVTLTGSAATGFSGTEADVTLGFAGIDILTGTSAAGSILTGEDAASTWGLDGTPTYSDGAQTLSFSGFVTLQGGSGNDVFDVDATFAGAIDGKAGTDTLQGDVIDAITLTGSDATGFKGTEADVTLGFAGIDTFTGTGANGSVFTGWNATSTWDLDGTPTYSDGTHTLNVSGFATLQGGGKVDTFNVIAATAMNIKGGAEADIVNLSATLTGNISTEAGADLIDFKPGGSVTGNVDGGSSATLDFTAQAGPIAVVLTGVGSIDGFQGTATGIVGTFDNITEVKGSAGADTLTGANAISTWSLGATQTYASGGQTLAFSGIETLQGGTDADTFNVAAATAEILKGGAGADLFDVDATLTGSIDGEAGADTLQGDVIDVVVLTASTANGFTGTEADVTAGFAGIDTLTGTGAAGSSLTGENVVSTWGLDGTPTYFDGAQTLNFSGFATLQGGIAADTFNVTAATAEILKGGNGNDLLDIDAKLTGSIDGEAGADTLQGDVIDVVVLTASTANGFTGTEADVTAGFAGIDTLTGTGAVGSSLTGENVLSTWGLDGTPTYSDGPHTLNFSGFATLQGGTAADTFNVTAATAEILKGGNGKDLFDVDAKLTGSVDGEAGADTLQGDVINVVVLTKSTANGFTGTEADITGGFAGIDTLTGTGAAGSSLTGVNAVSTWGLDGTPTYFDGAQTLDFSGFATLQGGTDADTFNVTAATTEILKGGNGNDVFDIDAKLTGSVDGEAGADTLQGDVINVVVLTSSTANGFSGTEDDVTLGLAGIDTLTGTGAAGSSLTGEDVVSTWGLDGTPTYFDGAQTLNFSGFATLQGGTAADTFNVTAATTEILKGGAGDDLFTVTGGVNLTGSIDGEAGNDTLADTGGNTWTVTSANGGSTSFILSGGFANVENLTGGSGADGFTLGTAGSLTGGIDGGAGDNTLAQTNGVNTWTIDGPNSGLVTDVGAGFSNIENLVGGSDSDQFTINLAGRLDGTIRGGDGTDTLAQSGGTNAWNVTGSGSGTVTDVPMGFSSIENLTGGADADTFTFQPAGFISGLVDGGGGSDILGFVGTEDNDLYCATDNLTGTVEWQQYAAWDNYVQGKDYRYQNVETLRFDTQGGDDQVTFYMVAGNSTGVQMIGGADTGNFHPAGYLGVEDGLKVVGTSGADTAVVGAINSGSRFQVDEATVETVQMFGMEGNDTLTNNTSVPSMIDGGPGKDTLNGGSGSDVIFGGEKTGIDDTDSLYGNAGDDYLFPDDEYLKRSATDHSQPIHDPISDGDYVNGGPGIDTAIAWDNDGVADVDRDKLAEIEYIGGSSTQLDWQTWLRATLLQPTQIDETYAKATGESWCQEFVCEPHTNVYPGGPVGPSSKGSTPGLYDPNSGTFYLRNNDSTGPADTTFGFGPADPTWIPLAGDWDGDGIDTVGVYNPTDSVFYLRNSNTSGEADVVVSFGYAGLTPLVGDWDGDGFDTVGLYDKTGSVFYMRNSNTSGYAEMVFGFGPGGDWKPVVGDWDGNGTDSVGLYDPAMSVFYLRDSNTAGMADRTFGFGAFGMGQAVAGDWDGNGTTTIGLYDKSSGAMQLRNANDSGYADVSFAYGPAGANWAPVFGHWSDAMGIASSPVASLPKADAADAVLTQAQLDAAVSDVNAHWASLGLSTRAGVMSAEVTDLPGNRVAVAYDNKLLVDRDAAGRGWALDAHAVDQVDLETVVSLTLVKSADLDHVQSSSSLDGELDRLISAALADDLLPEQIR